MSDNATFGFRDNCFDVIRMVSAILIMIGHTASNLSVTVRLPGWSITSMWIGLVCLFTISGYLIPASLERSKTYKEFLRKRFARLYPGLWNSVFLSLIALLFVGGGICGLKFSITDIIKWLIAQITVFQSYTPQSIAAYGVGKPNGPLWTIFIEVSIYFFVMVFWKWLKNRKTYQWILMIVVSMLVNVLFGIVYDNYPTTVIKMIGVSFIPYMHIFLIGMFLYAKKEKIIPLLIRNFWKLLLGYYIWFSANNLLLNLDLGHYCNIVDGVFVAILTIAGGYHFGRIKLSHELSFGIYIYHMIVVNILFMVGFKENWIALPIVVLVTLCLAEFSSHYIEKPFMRFLECKKKI